MTLRKATNTTWGYVERKEGPLLRKKMVRYYRYLIGKAVVLGTSGQPLEWEASNWIAPCSVSKNNLCGSQLSTAGNTGLSAASTSGTTNTSVAPTCMRL